MNEDTRAAIVEHAAACFPRECCGLVVVMRGGRERYVPCRNLAATADHFILDPEDYARAEDAGDVLAVVHSHPNVSPEPSAADRVACEASGLPWHIVSYPARTWRTLEPTGYRAPLIGRPFSHGVLDCYSLIRDYYMETLGLALPDFHRVGEWWKAGKNLYVDNFEAAGFARVKDGPQPHDVLLMQLRSAVPNHGAIYLGDGIILQHLQGRLSGREPYGGMWQKNTTHILRHTRCAK